MKTKTRRVFNYHRHTVRALAEILGAAGLSGTAELRPEHIQRRVSPTEVRDYRAIYDHVEPGALLSGNPPRRLAEAWSTASAEHF